MTGSLRDCRYGRVFLPTSHLAQGLASWQSSEAEPPPAECDAVVVGGGIAGTPVAYFLASRGLDVTLPDRRQVASGQSGQNAG